VTAFRGIFSLTAGFPSALRQRFRAERFPHSKSMGKFHGELEMHALHAAIGQQRRC
jgi:hypothetical protein